MSNKCHNFKDCYATVHGSTTDCMNSVEEHYKVRINGQVGYACQRCQKIDFKKFPKFVAIHRSHLGPLSEETKAVLIKGFIIYFIYIYLHTYSDFINRINVESRPIISASRSIISPSLLTSDSESSSSTSKKSSSSISIDSSPSAAIELLSSTSVESTSSKLSNSASTSIPSTSASIPSNSTSIPSNSASIPSISALTSMPSISTGPSTSAAASIYGGDIVGQNGTLYYFIFRYLFYHFQ
jgi:hypothetical protein